MGLASTVAPIFNMFLTILQIRLVRFSYLQDLDMGVCYTGMCLIGENSVVSRGKCTDRRLSVDKHKAGTR